MRYDSHYDMNYVDDEYGESGDHDESMHGYRDREFGYPGYDDR